MAPRPTSKTDTSTDADQAPAEATAAPASDTASEPASTSPDPQRVIIEQAPAEPAVFYGDGNATDPNKPHVKAQYEPFEW